LQSKKLGDNVEAPNNGQGSFVTRSRVVLLLALLILLSASTLLAQDEKPSDAQPKLAVGAASAEEAQAEALQKAVQNPVASLIRFRCRTTRI
jgi:hypothetical protein